MLCPFRAKTILLRCASMNFRSTYLLLGLVIAALGGLAIYILVAGGGKQTSLSAEGFLMQSLKGSSIKPESINTVELEIPAEQGRQKIIFARDEKTHGW